MTESFIDPHEKLQKKTDNLIRKRFGNPSIELQKVTDNLAYIQEASDNPIKKDEYKKVVFGYKTVDMSGIERNNIWSRTILTTDKISRMFLRWNIDQLLKYEKKRRKMDSKLGFLLILLGGGAIAVIIVLLLLTGGL